MSYIKYDNKNSMWNNGHIIVYKDGKCIEHIFVDDFLEENTNEDIWGVDDIIDMLKEKYQIEKVIKIENNWR